MADISQIQISNTVYDIKDNPARTEISEMPHSTSGTIGGWAIYDGYIEPEDWTDRALRFYSSDSTENDCHIEGYKDSETVLQIYPEYIHTPRVEIEDYLVNDGTTILNGQFTLLGDASVSSNIYLNNESHIYGQTTDGNNVVLIHMSNNDNINIGTAGGVYNNLYLGSSSYTQNVYIRAANTIYGQGSVSLNNTLAVSGATTLSSTLSVSSNITGSGHLYLANNKNFYVANTSGSYQLIAGMNTSNQALFGTTSNVTYLRGSTIYLQGATSLNSTLAVSGATTLSSTLAVSGITNLNNTINIANSIGIRLTNTSGTAYQMFRMNSDDEVLIGNTNYPTRLYGSTISANVTITTSSDKRLKQDITSLNEQEKSLIDTLIPVSYKLQEHPELTHFGFIAQDIEESLTNLDIHDYALVQTSIDDIKSIAYEEIIPLLVEEVHNLKEQIQELTKEINNE